MNILVTGAAGFIASHLIEKLLENNSNNIIGIDNFYSGSRKNLEFIANIDEFKKFKFIECDIRDFVKLNQIIKDYSIVQIYHLAAFVSVQDSIKNPLVSHEINVKGSLNILEASRLNCVKKIVFSSSAAVYGDEKDLPKNENSSMHPISPYGHEKLVAEYYMRLYNELYGLETITLRYFNVYGPRQSANSDYSGVISIFEKNFKENKASNIYGSGEQYRDFIYVKDVADINIAAMKFKSSKYEVFCVGTGQKVSINQIFNLLNKKYDKSMIANYLPSRKGDIKESLCNNFKLKSKIKIEKLISFEEGILKI
ncbi:NAD-dependent epimerase/dehydratase family protein [Aliarcobacter butzleri]|jgi:UDP-glucose 4-epimerase|uniref:NAD-dependent epimerase/dehydratase family protein n=1 Tax=Aliarcobacter butzleri TaxID=28197 RepID=UPI0012612D2D|nr:NAD-dependent epimerase/dehydratase family protein [Aliarcobacter butzleri]